MNNRKSKTARTGTVEFIEFARIVVSEDELKLNTGKDCLASY